MILLRLVPTVSSDKIPLFRPHRDKAKLDKLLPGIRAMQALASQHGIDDIFQDNGGKYLQLALVTGLKLIVGREGNDATDEHNNEYELKTLNADRVKSFTTHHHLNPIIIAKYRKVNWVFAVYRGIELQTVYFMPVNRLESYFVKWHAKWHSDGGKDINNPKIPLKFVQEFGIQIYPKASVPK